MGRVRIVTDSSAQFLDPGVIDRYQIEIIPLTLRISAQSYRDGIDINTETFFRTLARDRGPVQIVPPSPSTFAELYARLNRQTDQIVSIHLSRGLSDLWSNAKQATRTLLGRCEIEVIDSMTTSVGLAMLAEEAARVAAGGASLDEVVHTVRGMVSRIYSVFYLESLEYLRYNALLTEAQVILGSMLDVKPLLTIEDGELIPIEKVRTPAQAIDRLVEFVIEFSDVERLVIVQHTPHPTEQTRLLLERLTLEFPHHAFPVVQYNPSLGALIGPEAMGIIVYEALPNREEDM